MKNLLLIVVLMFGSLLQLFAQERTVKINFESGSFINNPNIPFDKPFLVQGEAGKDIEMVKVNILNENKNYILHSFVWNRYANNNTETFNIVIPAILRSNSRYDFEIITYKLMSENQKQILLAEMENRIRFFLQNNIYFDGKAVSINRPKDVYKKLKSLIDESLLHQESKNSISYQAPSSLVLDELQKQNEFRFSGFLKRKTNVERDSIANQLISRKVEHLTSLIISEVKPYINSQLVQHYRKVEVKAVSTDKEPFTLPINAGMYMWDMTLYDNPSVHNINFTPGVGVTIPFNSKTRFAARHSLFDSFGFSAGILFDQVRDADGNEFTTPWVNLPLYTALGFRVFKVVRLNAGVLILGEKGTQDFSDIQFLPTVGITLELNMWMGVKK
jgi:hypothetical protein